MYFNNKEETNIDEDFHGNYKKIIKINKKIVYICLGVLALIAIIFLVIKLLPPTTKYFLELIGDENISLYQNEDYIEPGYRGYDSNQNDLTNEVEIDNHIDTSELGEHTITYNLHSTSVQRKITIVEKPATATYIHLLGSLTINLEINSEYKDPGYIVFDSSADNLKANVKVSGKVDTSKPGIYEIIYSVVNSSGVTITNQRTVIVSDSSVSYKLQPSTYTNQNVSINITSNDPYFNYMILPDGKKITNNNYSYSVSQNGDYKITTYNKQGKSKETVISVKNIDRQSPSGTCTLNITNESSYISINASDNSGISKYIYNGSTYTTNRIETTNETSSAQITLYDNCGNTKEITCGVNKTKQEKLEIHFIKVGNGRFDAILYRLGNKTLFIDGGESKHYPEIDSYLKALGVKNIDILVGSHGHKNHVGPHDQIIANYNVKEAYYNQDIYHCVVCESGAYTKIIKELEARNIKPVISVPGSVFYLGDVKFECISPISKISSSDVNSYSSNYIVSYQGVKILTTGDYVQEDNIMKKYSSEFLKIDILKYPHHGNNSMKKEFINIIKPKYVVVTSRDKNGLVSNSRKWFNEIGATIYEHYKDGNIVITIDDGKISFKTNVDPKTYSTN